MRSDEMNSQNEIGACPSEFALERLRLGELEGGAAGRATAFHVACCDACAKRSAAISGAPPSFPLDAVWREVHGQAPHGRVRELRADHRARQAVDHTRVGRRLAVAFVAAVATVAAAAGAVLLLRPRPPADLVKGGPWALTVIAKPRGREEVTRIASGARLSPGDRLRFEVSTTWPLGYAVIIGLDSAGLVSPLVPSEGQAIEITRGHRVLFDGAVELDQSTGMERIDLLGCPRQVSVAKLAGAARAALRRQGGDLRRVGRIAPDCHQETFWIEKVKS
jgi:hypothetical protein